MDAVVYTYAQSIPICECSTTRTETFSVGHHYVLDYLYMLISLCIIYTYTCVYEQW